jgi:histidinol-phosphate/aromatic aminotransferase/cobyric acid decarboxylase-like protein
MDLNASPYRPTPWFNKLAEKLSKMDVNLYPDIGYRRLRKGLSSYTGFRF